MRNYGIYRRRRSCSLCPAVKRLYAFLTIRRPSSDKGHLGLIVSSPRPMQVTSGSIWRKIGAIFMTTIYVLRGHQSEAKRIEDMPLRVGYL